MTLKDYTECCKKFAADSAEWGGLDPYKHYVATPHGWVESCDNAENGIDVSWAFNVPADTIDEKTAWAFYSAEFQRQYEQGADEGWDSDQMSAVYSLFEDCINTGG